MINCTPSDIMYLTYFENYNVFLLNQDLFNYKVKSLITTI